eukprot:COSAG02_NODE_379_length_23528_cov_140.781510_9_plen_839_part_00
MEAHYTPRPPPPLNGEERSAKSARRLSHGVAASAGEGQWRQQPPPPPPQQQQQQQQQPNHGHEPGPAVLWLDLASASLAEGVGGEIDTTHAGLRRSGVDVASFVDPDSALTWSVQNILQLVCVCVQLESKHLLRKSELVVQLLRQFKGLGIPVLAIHITKRTDALRESEQICQAEDVPVLRDAAVSMHRVMELVASSYAFVDGHLQRIGTGTDDDTVRPVESVSVPEPQLPPGAMPFDSVVYEGPVYPTAPPFNPTAGALRKVVPPAFERLAKGRASIDDAPAKRGKLPTRLVVDPAQADRVAECQRCKKLSDRLRAAQCEVDAHKMRLKHVVLASNRPLEEAPAGSVASWDQLRGKKSGGVTSSWLRKGERERADDRMKDKEAEIRALKAKLQLLAAAAQAKANSTQERDWLSEQMSQEAIGVSVMEAKQLEKAKKESTALLVQVQQQTEELEAAAKRLEKEQHTARKAKLLVKKQENQIAGLQSASTANARKLESLSKHIDENVSLANRVADADERAEAMDATVLELRKALQVESATITKLHELLLAVCAVDSASAVAQRAYVEDLAQMGGAALRTAGEQWGAFRPSKSEGQGTTYPGMNLEVLRSQIKQRYLAKHAQEALDKAQSTPSATVEPQLELDASRLEEQSDEEQYIKIDGKWVQREAQSLAGISGANDTDDLEPQTQIANGTDGTEMPENAGHASGDETDSSDEARSSSEDKRTVNLGAALRARSSAAAWVAEAREKKAGKLAEALLLDSKQTEASVELRERYRNALRVRMQRATEMFVPSEPAQQISAAVQQAKDSDSEEEGEATSTWLQNSASQAAELAVHLASKED